MKRITPEIIQFLENQGFVIVSTLSSDGLHTSCKGIVKIDPKGFVYLLDLYQGQTYKNLKKNPRISITAVDEHKFMGYCLKGKARIIPQARLKIHIIKEWEDRIIGRVTRRILKNIHEQKGHLRHPEVLLPKPQYMIIVRIEDIVDLTPHQLK